MIKKEPLKLAKTIDKQICSACNYNNAKCEFIRGCIITVNRTNVSFIEPHRAIINIKNVKLVLVYFDDNNLFLFDRSIPFTTSKLVSLFKKIRKGGV